MYWNNIQFTLFRPTIWLNTTHIKMTLFKVALVIKVKAWMKPKKGLWNGNVRRHNKMMAIRLPLSFLLNSSCQAQLKYTEMYWTENSNPSEQLELRFDLSAT